MMKYKPYLLKFKWRYIRWFVHHPQSRKIRKIYNISSADILPKDANYFLSIVAIFKGEDFYLLEWIEFHRLMGVEHFFLYDNGLESSSAALLEPYVQAGIVTHIQFPNRKGLKDEHNKIETLTIQQLAYGDCLLRFRDHLHYLIQLDIDEFLYPTSETVPTIASILKSLDSNKTKGIEINWKIFGSNNHDSKPPGLVIENYTQKVKDLKSLNLVNVKSIGNVKFLSNKYQFTYVHQFIYRFSLKDYFKKILTGEPRIIRGKEADQLFQLNHYKMKSREEYQNRKSKYGQGWWGEHDKREFDKINDKLNQADDSTILRYVPNLKFRLVKIQDSSRGPYLPELSK